MAPETDIQGGAPESQKLPKHVDIGAILRAHFAETEKNAYAEWIQTLTPEELKSYETMGYQFQLLHAVCKNPEVIALSSDEASAERFSFREVLLLAIDLEKEAETFLGRESTRQQNPLLDKFQGAFNALRAFRDKQKLFNFLETKHDYSLSVTADFDEEFLELLGSQLPPDMITILRRGDGIEEEGGAVSRQELTNSFAHLVHGLQLNDQEKEKLKEGIRILIKAKNKIIQGRKDGQEMNNLEFAELEQVVSVLGSMECLRRVYPASPELGVRSNDKIFGLSEIHRLLKFIRSWKKTFRWLAKMKVGKFNNGEEREETDEERETKRDTIRNFTDSFTMIFPDPVAPMVVKRHREVLRRNLQQYRALGAIINGIEDRELQADLKRVLFQISTILSYLDYMWSMHRVAENGAGKHIVYPKKMLLLGPLILQETENLGATINYISEKYRGFPEEGGETEKGFFDIEMEQPSGLGVNYQDSTAFKVGPDSIIFTTRDETKEVMEGKPEEGKAVEKTDAEKKNEALVNNLEAIAVMLIVTLKNARDNLQATRVKTVLVNDEDPVEAEKKSPQTLSYDIHDFMHDLRDGFSSVLFEIARTFDSNATRHQILPETAAHEEQAARLRGQVYALGTSIRPATEVMAMALDTRTEAKIEEFVPAIREIVQGLAGDIREFRAYQERKLNEKKYHEVLRGAGYEKLARLANSVTDFDANYNEALDAKVLNLFILRKHIDQFADKTRMKIGMGELPRNGITGAWLKDLELLKKVENKILANGLKPAEMEETQKAYSEKFMHVVNVFYDIAKSGKDEVDHIFLDEPDQMTYKVPDQVRQHFAEFWDSNDLMENCDNKEFTPVFFKFFKLMHLMSDFVQVCNLQMDANTPGQNFLKEYDMKKAQVLLDESRKLLEADYSTTSRIQRNNIILSIATCREALGHLVFRAPEKAETLEMILADMENTIKVLYEHGKPIKPDDLETFYLQFIREEVEEPIIVK